MLKARPGKEVVVRLPNEIGTLNEIARAVSEKGLNVLAICAWVEGSEAIIRLVTEDTSRVADTLRSLKHLVRESEVVVSEVPHKPGMLRHITDALAQAEIDIHHLYATATASQQQCLVVFATANNDRAIVRLNAERS